MVRMKIGLSNIYAFSKKHGFKFIFRNIDQAGIIF